MKRARIDTCSMNGLVNLPLGSLIARIAWKRVKFSPCKSFICALVTPVYFPVKLIRF